MRGIRSVNDIEKEIQAVNATMAMEGMPLSDVDKDNIRTVLRGDVSFEEMRKRIIEKHRPNKEKKMETYERI